MDLRLPTIKVFCRDSEIAPTEEVLSRFGDRSYRKLGHFRYCRRDLRLPNIKGFSRDSEIAPTKNVICVILQQKDIRN
jgi:hypothetical protein